MILAVSGCAGYAAAQRAGSEVTVTDDESAVSVTVPGAWDHAVATDGWRPAGADTDYPAVSVGTTDGWASPASTAQGVFVGVLPGDELPDAVAAASRV